MQQYCALSSSTNNFTTANEVWGKVVFLLASVILFREKRGPLFDVTSCLSAWSHVPLGGLCQGGSASRGTSVHLVSVWGSLSRAVSLQLVSVQGGVSVQWGSLFSGGLCLKVSVQEGQRDPLTVKSRRYASYWNAFLFLLVSIRLLIE